MNGSERDDLFETKAKMLEERIKDREIIIKEKEKEISEILNKVKQKQERIKTIEKEKKDLEKERDALQEHLLDGMTMYKLGEKEKMMKDMAKDADEFYDEALKVVSNKIDADKQDVARLKDKKTKTCQQVMKDFEVQLDNC